MEPTEVIIHPDSLRALAYEVLNQLYGAGPVDDSRITIYQIEAELRAQYNALMEKDDQLRFKLGQLPDPSRLRSVKVTLTDAGCAECDKWLRSAKLGEFVNWNGGPYIKGVSACGLKFVPVTSSWQLPIVSERGGRPTYVAESGVLKIHHTARTVAVDEVTVQGIPKDRFHGTDRNDPMFWNEPFTFNTQADRALIKERAEIRLRGGSVATWQRSDQRNNGTETPINTQN